MRSKACLIKNKGKVLYTVANTVDHNKNNSEPTLARRQAKQNNLLTLYVKYHLPETDIDLPPLMYASGDNTINMWSQLSIASRNLKEFTNGPCLSSL